MTDKQKYQIELLKRGGELNKKLLCKCGFDSGLITIRESFMSVDRIEVRCNERFIRERAI